MAKETTIKFELYCRTHTQEGFFETITPYRYKTLEKAQEKQRQLNFGLRYKNYNNTKYVIAKVTREYFE